MTVQHDRPEEKLDFTGCFRGEPPEGSITDDLSRAHELRQRRRRTMGAAFGGLAALALSAALVTTLQTPGPVSVPADQPSPPAAESSRRAAEQRERADREDVGRERGARQEPDPGRVDREARQRSGTDGRSAAEDRRRADADPRERTETEDRRRADAESADGR